VFETLEDYTRSRFDVVSIDYRWSGQILEPVDGIAYIGRHTTMEHVYVGTGYSGTGITFGTVAGMVLSDLILGVENPWADVYDPRRMGPLAQAREFVAENLDFPMHFVGDRVRPPDVHGLSEIAPGEGAIVNAAGKKLAVYRDDAGEVHALSPVCTHMGCHVQWNKAEKSWDCPCHGGRYDARGVVINGPPTRDLKPISFPEEKPQKETTDERTGSAEETAP
jgi:Rieske Fe-S protein